MASWIRDCESSLESPSDPQISVFDHISQSNTL